VRWMVPVYSETADSPPIIANNMIFADMATIPNPYLPNKGTYALAALSLDTGKVVWQAPTDVGPSLPVLEDGVLYLTSTVEPCNDASCYTYFVSAFNVADGRRLWRVQVDQQPVAPVVANGKVYVVIEHTPNGGAISFALDAFDAQSGALLWQTPLQGQNQAQPGAGIAAITSDVVYVSISGTNTGPGTVIAVDAQGGAPEWTWNTDGFIGGLMVIH
jgi:outer membrane protein assembly factor BamB